MKKNEQIEINTYVENIVNDINALLCTSYGTIKWHRLYHCSAYTCAVGDWIILRSYYTIVAAYNVETGEMFDFLRMVYGYTSTSAQHITKFRNFCRDINLECNIMYRWYKV